MGCERSLETKNGTQTLAHVEPGVGWDVNVPRHLTKNGAQRPAYIRIEPGVGWGGMLMFPGACQPRMAHKH